MDCSKYIAPQVRAFISASNCIRDIKSKIGGALYDNERIDTIPSLLLIALKLQ